MWLLVASIAPDILDGVYALARVCSPYGVYSHSLPAIAVLAAITMVLAYAGTRAGAAGLTERHRARSASRFPYRPLDFARSWNCEIFTSPSEKRATISREPPSASM